MEREHEYYANYLKYSVLLPSSYTLWVIPFSSESSKQFSGKPSDYLGAKKELNVFLAFLLRMTISKLQAPPLLSMKFFCRVKGWPDL